MNTKNKIKLGVIITIVAVLAIKLHHNEYFHKELPPGFGIVCDGKGHYAPSFENGCIILDGDSPNAWSSRQDAINRAWSQYEYEHLPRETNPSEGFSWHNCDN